MDPLAAAALVRHSLASYYINVKNEVDEDFLSVTRIPTGSLITKRSALAAPCI